MQTSRARGSHKNYCKKMPRVSRFEKIFFYCTTLSLLIFMIILIRDARTDYINYPKYDFLQSWYRLVGGKISSKSSDTKYILAWTGLRSELHHMGRGRQGFIDNECPVNNCFVTSDKNLFRKGYTDFDAIVFFGPQVRGMPRQFLPQRRSPRQKYIFASSESSDYYPVCDPILDGFFNWTWTYKLDSDARWGYIVVRDAEGAVIGPKTEMHWTADMNPIDDNLKDKLKSKTKAAAWFASNCHSESGREKYVKEVQNELKKFNLTVDIYGNCGPLKCSKKDMEVCLQKLEDEYYFYFSFENSLSEDYVTEKLIHALKYNTVPVVYGGANYTRFMPDGIYLNARELSPAILAQKMHEAILDPEQYYQYFRYKNHYSFYLRMQSVETNDYCNLCKLLNDETLVNKSTVYDNFREWWNPKSHRKC